MTILFRPQGAFGWFSYTTSRDTIDQRRADLIYRATDSKTLLDLRPRDYPHQVPVQSKQSLVHGHVCYNGQYRIQRAIGPIAKLHMNGF
ncbi:hypothetical protein BGP82_14080 [Pseudomonas putida]|uniref:Uncharacterized protein n=1 Tax=Pseudomonas putida TaxID=303 RepID=A0A2S3WMA4_PSEPU|nr:hypothetical protein BGP82_14080 [Pseudomonas putida]